MDAGRVKAGDAYLQAIQEACPDLAITSAGFNAQGQNSDVVVVNGELIFRFPKYPHVLEKLRTETVILRCVQRRLPLAVVVVIHLIFGAILGVLGLGAAAAATAAGL